ncbi:hypothetical protein LAZ40_01820 [Cereibacter sphaeroides]|uniref:hypothetical protein n=1 Tax=Cereibacter sphaeroides TaxID=1063 RepID=UPI001F31EE89|nr:hypothetical protein [Cereibacter sphaeroides]MCE6957796.1 hypothetical protein [Cereibacter sphaeroides]MCE6969847.1 hypothetical protein [Cereibacter sphaeroides]MCE6971690.1 hypothetical protein [Cereibacter sphaeroides]
MIRVERREQVRSVFAANYLTFQYQFVEFFAEHLSDLSRVFKGDLQQMIVLALLGQVRMRAMRDAAADGLDPWTLPEDRVSTSASRLADVTGIPRETVRRKLALLEAKGWATRGPQGRWSLAVEDRQAVARLGLEALDARAIDRVARLVTDLERML